MIIIITIIIIIINNNKKKNRQKTIFAKIYSNKINSITKHNIKKKIKKQTNKERKRN